MSIKRLTELPLHDCLGFLVEDQFEDQSAGEPAGEPADEPATSLAGGIAAAFDLEGSGPFRPSVSALGGC